MTNQVYHIPAVNFPRLQEEVAKLNKRAEKLNTEPIVLEILESVTQKKRNEVVGFEYEETYHVCIVKGFAPKLAGWTFVAIIEPVANGENFIREVPGQKCPSMYRGTKMICDHCGENRKRNSVFVLRNDSEEFKRVGRNCLADFLGHENPEDLLARAEYMLGFDKLVSESRTEGWGRAGSILIPIEEFTAVTAVVIRKLGWVPKSKAIEGQRCTADIVWDLCVRPNERDIKQLIREKRLFAEENDILEAKDAIQWASNIESNIQSTYLYDLGVCCRQTYVDSKRRGFVASVISAYKRHILMLQQELGPEPAYASKHVGEINKRQKFEDLKITHRYVYYNGPYARTKVKFLDKDGNILVWRASGIPEWPEVDKIVSVNGTVKKHLNVSGIFETEMNRVQPVVLDTIVT